MAAAEVARQLYAHEETADLLRAAYAAMADDPEVTPRQRYDVLLRLIDAYRWSAMWPELTATVEQAVDVAEEIGDPELVAAAAISTTQGALWQSAPHGEVHEGVVRALRSSLDRLPAEDGALRCRVLLGLANELYYGASFEERRALVDEGLAMARRLEGRGPAPGRLPDRVRLAVVDRHRGGAARPRRRGGRARGAHRQRAGHRGGGHAAGGGPR